MHISKYKLLIFFAATVITFFIILQAPNIQKDIYPEFSLPYIEVQTEALGLSGEEIQNLVTVNLEEMLYSTPWLESIESKSTLGVSSIILKFKPNTDLIKARQMVQENLALAHLLPNVSKPPVILQPTSSTNRVMMISLTSEIVSIIDMSTLARWNMLPVLLSVPGVANVSIWGYEDRQFQVRVDPQKLASNNITLNQIITTSGNTLWTSPLSFLQASTTGSGGWIDTDNQRLGILHVFPIQSPNDLAEVPVVGAHKSVTLGEVTNVVENHQPLIGSSNINNIKGLVLVVEKFPGTDVINVTNALEEKLKELSVGLKNINISTEVFRPATFVQSLFDTFYLLSLIIFLLLFALFYFFYRLKIAIIGVTTICLTFFTTILILFLLGFTLNIMVVFAFVVTLGLLVQSVILLLEDIKKNVVLGSVPEKIVSSLQFTYNKSISSTIITICLALPLLLIKGELGLFIYPFIITYTLTLLVSMLVCILFTPSLVSIFFRDVENFNSIKNLFAGCEKCYSHFLESLLSKKELVYISILTLITLILVSGLFLANKDIELPVPNDPNIVIEFDNVTGASYDKTNIAITNITKDLLTVSGVQGVITNTGRAIMGDTLVGIHSSQIWVKVDSYTKTIEEIKRVVESHQGINVKVKNYSKQIIDKVIPNETPLFVRLYGPKFSELQLQGELLKKHILTNVEGVSNVAVVKEEQRFRIEIEVDLESAKNYGLKPGEVRRAVSTIVNGLVVGYFFEDEKVYEVTVWSDPNVRKNIDNIKDILIYTSSGNYIDLDSIANIRLGKTRDIINREGFSSFVDISFNVKDNFQRNNILMDLKKTINKYEYPVEYRSIIIDNDAKKKDNAISLLLGLIIFLIFVYFVLQYTFNSWRLALLAFGTLPLSLSGGVFIILLSSGWGVSLGSLVGFLTIFAIAVRNGILLLKHYQHLEEKENKHFSISLVIKGVVDKFSAIMMTTLVTGLALIPLIIVGDIPGNEIEYPMAIVILGGLTTSTIVTLFILPTLYYIFGKKKGK